MRHLTTRSVFALAICGVLFFAVFGLSQESDQHSRDMRKKLDDSKQILEGLVNEDYDKMLRAAESLNKLGKRKWIENDSPTYRAQNQVFWFATGTLVMAAKEKNLDGATLAYTQMTQSCVNCHKYLRRH